MVSRQLRFRKLETTVQNWTPRSAQGPITSTFEALVSNQDGIGFQLNDHYVSSVVEHEL
jgi:hypothetical protein